MTTVIARPKVMLRDSPRPGGEDGEGGRPGAEGEGEGEELLLPLLHQEMFLHRREGEEGVGAGARQLQHNPLETRRTQRQKNLPRRLRGDVVAGADAGVGVGVAVLQGLVVVTRVRGRRALHHLA